MNRITKVSLIKYNDQGHWRKAALIIIFILKIKSDCKVE